jgi:hypothetical protein
MSDRPWDSPTFRERYLYNPGPAFSYEFANETFHFPAYDKCWVDPQTKKAWHEPGVMPVRPRGQHKWWNKEVVLEGQPAFQPKPHTAAEVVGYFLGDDFKSGHLGKTRGVRELSPSDAKDESIDAKIKEDARTSYLRNRYEQAQQNIARAKASNAKAAAENRPIEAANAILLEDYKFVAEYDSLVSASLPRHQCPECFNRFVEKTGAGSLEAHINALHPSNAADLLITAGITEPKKKIGRPKKVAA